MSVVPLINLLLFAVGAALYALLAVMVARFPVRSSAEASSDKTSLDWQLLATGVFGLLWNAGNIAEFFWRDFLNVPVSPFLSAIGYAALGFLPAVAVHSAQTSERKNFRTLWLTLAAYALSVFAAAAHFYCVAYDYAAPFVFGLRVLTFGYAGVLAAIFLFNFRQSAGRRAILISALAVFAVSAFHLSQPHGVAEKSLLVEFVGHHASLPLALVILYQDFRFAFADLFLKRALSLLLLTVVALGLHIFVGLPLAAMHAGHPPSDPLAVATTLGLWIATALVYPKLYQLAVWLVDKILLRRVDYERLRTKIMLKLATLESIESVLEETSQELQTALTANFSVVEEFYDSSAAPLKFVALESNEAEVLIPTVETPQYKILLRDFRGGRRLLSDETEMLKDAAFAAARRIDALRHTHERCEQEIREQRFSNLATEAELRALRAQINPHFLFNALTTIGYLIEFAPKKALDTLMQLTKLLRGALRSGSEFLTLGDEIKLIESYLEIEKARFEERLTVEIDVAPDTLAIRVPALILQPIVENAVKHGITPKKEGGTVRVSARRAGGKLILEVTDTGAGVSAAELETRRTARVGLNNVEQRLHLHFNGAANLQIKSEPGAGATVRIEINLKSLERGAARKAAENGVALRS